MAITGQKKNGSDNGSTDLRPLLKQGEEMFDLLAGEHMSWGLGTADGWELDQTTGTISWTFSDKTATAPAQILGTHNESTTSWVWAWANDSIPPAMSRDSQAVRAWLEANGHQDLAQPTMDADEVKAATLATLAVRITRATGFYRGSGAVPVPFITFGPVTLTTDTGETTTFEVDIDELTDPA
jgi:hypothetical protein